MHGGGFPDLRAADEADPQLANLSALPACIPFPPALGQRVRADERRHLGGHVGQDHVVEPRQNCGREAARPRLLPEGLPCRRGGRVSRARALQRELGRCISGRRRAEQRRRPLLLGTHRLGGVPAHPRGAVLRVLHRPSRHRREGGVFIRRRREREARRSHKRRAGGREEGLLQIDGLEADVRALRTSWSAEGDEQKEQACRPQGQDFPAQRGRGHLQDRLAPQRRRGPTSCWAPRLGRDAQKPRQRGVPTEEPHGRVREEPHVWLGEESDCRVRAELPGPEPVHLVAGGDPEECRLGARGVERLLVGGGRPQP
mmetsp:Transcript_22202/g.63042  ORF Transcript_22202/g.63042 Transcript_22202/m.63042 type:complete len:314 (-) Transcript_22202:256-1197(-)